MSSPRKLIDAVEVDDRVVRIHRSKTTLEQAVIASCKPGKGVRSFVRKWRSLGKWVSPRKTSSYLHKRALADLLNLRGFFRRSQTSRSRASLANKKLCLSKPDPDAAYGSIASRADAAGFRKS
jgi:hypothetical protein